MAEESQANLGVFINVIKNGIHLVIFYLPYCTFFCFTTILVERKRWSFTANFSILKTNERSWLITQCLNIEHLGKTPELDILLQGFNLTLIHYMAEYFFIEPITFTTKLIILESVKNFPWNHFKLVYTKYIDTMSINHSTLVIKLQLTCF